LYTLAAFPVRRNPADGKGGQQDKFSQDLQEVRREEPSLKNWEFSLSSFSVESKHEQ
jgi:hypothetical protein